VAAKKSISKPKPAKKNNMNLFYRDKLNEEIKLTKKAEKSA